MDYFNTFNALTAKQLKMETFKSEEPLLPHTVKLATIKSLRIPLILHGRVATQV